MSPGHIKRMTNALKENIEKYEGQFGKIEEAKTPEMSEGGIGFKMDK